MKLSIDADRYIAEHGGVSETARYLTLKGYPVTRACVSKWGRKKMIPMSAWLRINAVERGDMDLNSYLLETK